MKNKRFKNTSQADNPDENIVEMKGEIKTGMEVEINRIDNFLKM